MKPRIALVAAVLIIAMVTTVLILRTRNPAGDLGAAARKPPPSLSKPDAEPAAPPPPERESRSGKPPEEGFPNESFYKCFRCTVPLPLDEATVRRRIREARLSGHLYISNTVPHVPVHSMEEAFKRVWDYSYAPTDFMPTWGVEEEDFYFFSGNRAMDDKRPPSTAFEYGTAVRKTDGQFFLWLNTKSESP